MAAVAGLQHHHIGMLRLHQEKQGGDEAEYSAPMGGMYDCFGCATDGNHAVYRIQLMGISTLPVVVLPSVWVGVRNILHVSLMP